MSEPTDYLDVLDAFDAEDPLGVRVSLAFRHLLQTGDIHREVTDERTIDGRSTRRFVEAGEHERVRNEMALRLDIGLYHDLMAYFRVPVLLSESRQLAYIDEQRCPQGSTRDACRAFLEPPPGAVPSLGDPEQQLVAEIPAHAAKRSGIPHVEVGLAWAPTNQFRDDFVTWVLLAEASIATGDVMQPCLQGDANCSAGVSRGTTAVTVESRWSRRRGVVEPYFGIGHTRQWVTTGDELFTPAGELEGDVDRRPPSTTSGTVGAAVIPWEDRARFQRLTLDTRVGASLVTAGRDFTPLFDALGSSQNDYLTASNPEEPTTSPEDVALVEFTGLTHVEAHTRLALATSLVMRAARYVRFTLGLGLSYLTPHLLTGEAPCNPEAEPRSEAHASSCQTGVVNPAYRPVIDAPGQRFRLDSDTTVEISVSAAGQF